jgi:hypothetical protein
MSDSDFSDYGEGEEPTYESGEEMYYEGASDAEMYDAVSSPQAHQRKVMKA